MCLSINIAEMVRLDFVKGRKSKLPDFVCAQFIVLGHHLAMDNSLLPKDFFNPLFFIRKTNALGFGESFPALLLFQTISYFGFQGDSLDPIGGLSDSQFDMTSKSVRRLTTTAWVA